MNPVQQSTSSSSAAPRSAGTVVAQSLASAMLRASTPTVAELDAVVAALRSVLELRDIVLLVESHGLMVNGDEVDSVSAIRVLHRLGGARVRRVRIETRVGDGDLAALLTALRETDADLLATQLRERRVAGVSIELRDRAMLPSVPLPEEVPDHEPPAAEPEVELEAEPVALAPIPELDAAFETVPDPRNDAERLREHFERTALLFAQLLEADTSVDAQRFFGQIVDFKGSVPYLASCLSGDVPYVVVIALTLLRAKGAAETAARVIALMQHREPSVRVAAARALEVFATAESWVVLQAGLLDRVSDVRLRCLCAFDTRAEPLPVAVMREMLISERVEELSVAIVERLTPYRSHEVSRALARATIYHIKERGSVPVLRALLEQLMRHQPSVAQRLAHYLSGSPNPARAALGDELLKDDARSAVSDSVLEGIDLESLV